MNSNLSARSRGRLLNAASFAALLLVWVVLTIDLGGWKSRNLSDKRDAALVGVEDGVVTWISPPGGAGPDAGLLCVDAEGQAGAPRTGCWGWGNYRP